MRPFARTPTGPDPDVRVVAMWGNVSTISCYTGRCWVRVSCDRSIVLIAVGIFSEISNIRGKSRCDRFGRVRWVYGLTFHVEYDVRDSVNEKTSFARITGKRGRNFRVVRTRSVSTVRRVDSNGCRGSRGRTEK